MSAQLDTASIIHAGAVGAFDTVLTWRRVARCPQSRIHHLASIIDIYVGHCVGALSCVGDPDGCVVQTKGTHGFVELSLEICFVEITLNQTTSILAGEGRG